MKNEKLPEAPTDQRIVDSLIAGDDQLRELARDGVSEAAIRERARELGVTWEFIKQCRLSGSRPAIRACMRCDASFLSSGIENRLCRRCVRR
jgi:hypothetical protein